MTDTPGTDTAVSDTAAITVLGAEWCGDCRRTKRLLDRLGVDYTYVDLVAEPDRMAEVIERNGGRQNIPVVVLPDGSHVTEPSDPQMRGLLVEHGLLQT